MTMSNYIAKVAIVGAGGNSGSFMTKALISTGKHVVTAISREDSQSKLPDGVIVKKVDYNRPETIVEALRGQDALIITLSGHVPKGTDTELINAASEAGVPWVLPNEWSPDSANEDLVKDVFPFQSKVVVRKAIEHLGKSSYISVVTGFWYEWSLAIAPAFGIDLSNRKATFYDEGETKISVSTWPHIGRAVAALLSLPIRPEKEDSKQPCLENFRNKVVYTNSFTINQKEMFESALRVTGTKEDDWTTIKEPSHERYASGLEEIKQGQRIGFAKMMYTRVFFPDGCGDFEHKGTLNELLGLPKQGTEELDEATKVAIERAKATSWGH
ncbi:NAD(P)-binding protein [Polychaeton citri CBS 116435]|uniref:NAD(P)-binding protein n=1 Tax=Polychaeton citri CBS 116435 TaxID=1314669 RepID=A0A9P4QHY9_9PEZI|nr:NAD(P)-binding protein [Polychaeton citri CBS 116435]